MRMAYISYRFLRIQTLNYMSPSGSPGSHAFLGLLAFNYNLPHWNLAPN